jgi:cellobiose transport system permease protein
MSLSTTTAPPAPSAPAGSPQPPKRRATLRLGRFDLKVSPYLYVAPFFIVFGVFGAYPMFKTLYMSFTDWDLLNERTEGHTFVGFKNYAKMFGDEYYWNALTNTIGVFLLATIPQILLALLLANWLNRPLRARSFFRMAVLIPNATSVAAVAIIFGTLYQRDFGVINWVLEQFGFERINWHGARLSHWTAVATMVDWRWTGYNALILLAGMQAIPKDLYESAEIDGAGLWRQFWSVTFPLLRPTFLFVTVVSIVGGLQLFTEPLIFTNGFTVRGGDLREVQTLTMYMYENSIELTQNAGYGAAISWSLFILILLASLANFVLVRRSVK